jgi:hypothetical protein
MCVVLRLHAPTSTRFTADNKHWHMNDALFGVCCPAETSYSNPNSFPPGNMIDEKKVPADTAVDVVSGDVETQGFDALATKKLLRKLDWHIIPFMSLIYL